MSIIRAIGKVLPIYTLPYASVSLALAISLAISVSKDLAHINTL